jgi:hypothetical protein
MWRRWNELSGPERYEFWAWAGLYLPFAVALLYDLTLARVYQVRVPGLVVFLLLSAAQAGVCAALLHASVSRYLARGPAPRRWLVAAAIALTAAGVLAGAAAFPAFTRPSSGAFPVSMLVAMLLGGTLTVALAPLLRTRALLAVVLVGAAAASGMSASIGGAGVGAHGQALAAPSLCSSAASRRGSCGSCGNLTGRGPRRPACRSPRSGCASPATCTTCSAGTCP